MLEKIALQKKLISEKDCQAALDACKASEHIDEALKEYFISHGLISSKAMEQLLSAMETVKTIKKNIKFGAIALEMGLISNEALEEALEHQKKAAAQNQVPRLIGRILYEEGKLTKEQIQLILDEQNKRSGKIETGQKKDPAHPMPSEAIIKVPGSEEGKKTEDKSEVLPDGMILDIEEEKMAAFLRKTDHFNSTLSPDDIYSMLLSKGVQYGIESLKSIEGFIKSSGFKKNRFKIASGAPKVVGKDARIEYYFDTDHLKAGQIDEEGKMDFKNRGEIPKVEEKALLAEKFPAIEAKSGIDIYGNELFIEPAKDLQLPIGAGVILSEDGLKAFAEKSGHPRLSWSGTLSVIDTFVVKGDVGYETGHLQYNGNIEVQGCLNSGFRINGFDIRINEVRGGQIHAQGDVTVTAGLSGSVVYSRGHVSAKYIHNSKISCLGNVYVEKEIVDSQIETSGACRIAAGDIINSTTSAKLGVYVKNIGTDKTAPNKIFVGCDFFLSNEFKTIESTIAGLTGKRQSLERKKEKLRQDNRDLYQATTRMANELDMMDRSEDESHYRKLDQELNTRFDMIEKNEAEISRINSTFEDIKAQIEDLTQEKINFTDFAKANPGKPVVVAEGKVYSGTVIQSEHAQKEIEETISRVELKEIQLQINDAPANIYEIQVNDNFKRR